MPDDLCSLINSNGNLELFIFSGDASSAFGLRLGDKVFVRLRESGFRGITAERLEMS